MTIDEAKSEFEGKPYSKELAIQIESTGYGFATSAVDGKIAMIYKPLRPKACKSK
jgi:hypothetical protein